MQYLRRDLLIKLQNKTKKKKFSILIKVPVGTQINAQVQHHMGKWSVSNKQVASVFQNFGNRIDYLIVVSCQLCVSVSRADIEMLFFLQNFLFY